MDSFCIIHNKAVKIDQDDRLISPRSYESWLTLFEAAKVRNFEPVLELAKTLNENEVPSIAYHRQCRSRFTLKRDLESLRQVTGGVKENNNEDEVARPKKRNTSSSNCVEKCIFCSKDKYVRSLNSREKLVKAAQLRVDKTLRDTAVKKCDEKILAVTSRDIVAAQAHYHRSCYREYTRPTKTSQASASSDEEMDAEYDAFSDLFEYIRAVVLDKQKVVSMTDLAKELELSVQSKREGKLKESSKKHIRRKIEAEFGSTLEIFQNDKGKLLVMAANLSLRETVKSKVALENEIETLKLKTNDMQSVVDQCALYIRRSVLDAKWNSSWPIHPSDLTADHFQVPDCLNRFLKGVLAGDPGINSSSQRLETLVKSFSQDIIYATTSGRTKPPKQILLAYGVKTLTGNVELIQMLNRFGHGVSYSQLEENDTALCLQKMASNLNQSPILPEAIKPNVFTNLAWDNIDRLEETLTGEGTTHRVNGIAIQPRVYGPHLPQAALPVIPKRKQRSITQEVRPLQTYISGERVGPPPLAVIDNDGQQQQEAKMAARKNLIWLLARKADCNTDKQQIPGWTGFNIKARIQEPVTQDVVGYLPTINAPATHLSTVNEILRQSEEIRKTLNLKKIVVVMDQALYAKAAEVAWKNQDDYGSVLLRLGAFHTICNILSIIGKRFQDAGLRDICIESGIIAEGSVSSVLDGKMHNRAVRVHKCIYEALMRLVWQQFLSWVTSTHPNKIASVRTVQDSVNEMADRFTPAQHDAMMQSETLADVHDLWNQFILYLRYENGDLSAFWMSYIQVVEDVLLGLIRASREGNWQLHLHAVRQMIPWCFAYDKVNYARYLPVYYAQMMNLPTDHPDVHREFMNGHFSVQLGKKNPFGRLPVDQTTEVTVNKDTKTTGGVTKFSLKTGAVNRFYMTAEYRCFIIMHNLIKIHKDLYSRNTVQ